ncbi:glycosyltransferase [Mastigocladopsis repens]|uniref:glycosyltransferase n=1 Tax=Mastigocladopsis repens TaxID=221287 RepID=UPI0002EB9C65|nr:glycosyltransferase [Mastigocladopsis repens]
MNILYLTTVLPSQRKTGGEIASQSFIDALEQSGHKVLVVGYQRQGDVSLNKLVNEISVGQRYIETDKSKFYPLFWMGLSLIKKLPYSCAKYYSERYIKNVITLLNNQDYDVAIIDHAQVGWLLPFLSNKIKLIFIAHNVEHEVYLEQFQNTHNNISKQIYKREAHLIQELEDSVARKAKEVWTFTSYDASYFSNINKATRVFNIPSSLERLSSTTAMKTFDVGILGSWTWKANMLGLKWFFQEVYPLLPLDFSIQVAGRGAEWLQGQYPNVKYCGFVPDVQAFMAQAKVIAVPSISGGGVQIKTLDAIASGTPIVATPVAMRGICDYPSCVKVVEKPKDFADHLVELVANTAPDSCEDALIWSRIRQKKFFADVADAMNSIRVFQGIFPT